MSIPRCCGMFKDGGKGGKAEVGFPCFPRAGISTARSYCALAPFFCLSRVRRKRYDSVPVSRMCARSVMRSSRALQSRAFGITCVHSEKGKFVVKTTAILSARSAITWKRNSAPTSASGNPPHRWRSGRSGSSGPLLVAAEVDVSPLPVRSPIRRP